MKKNKKLFNTLPKLHLICANDILRKALQYVLVTKKETVATDAHCLVVYETELIFSQEFVENMPERFLIHKEIWAKICKKHHFICFENNMIKVIYETHTVFYPIMFEENLTLYPKYNHVLPTGKAEEIKSIGINPHLLSKLCKAIGINNAVKLTFRGESNCISVYFRDIPSIKAIIMPVLIIE